MKKQIELVHFQITKNCNLRCHFCGQWGGKGFFSSANGVALSMEEWMDCARQLKELSPVPKIILWGGEPLMCPFFDMLSEALFQMGFKLQLVTNGTLLNEHVQTVSRCFEKLYVSIDGLAEYHNSIRGKGVFERVTRNLTMIPKERVEIMTVATEGLQIEPFADYFRHYPILLQTLISFNQKEIEDYQRWFRQVFQGEASDIESWLGEGYVPDKSVIDTLPENITFMAHGKAAKNRYCLSPFRHIHISWNGNVMYCTDFYDFSAGNVRNGKMIDIFHNQRSEIFRREIVKGRCAACSHCSWRNNQTFE